jgi:hypothetical protein
MKYNCDVIHDLLPLYLDGVASAASRTVVDEHLLECDACAALLLQMKSNSIEAELESERGSVLAGQAKYFKRKSALAGSILAGIFMIPVLVCLIVNLATGAGLSWFFIVLAALMVAASLTIVPLIAPQNKGLWTLGTFAGALIFLFGVCCLYTGGSWFFVASAAVLFGLAVLFLPFAVRSGKLGAYLKNQKALAVMTVDTVLYALMMLSIGLYNGKPGFLLEAAAISAPFIVFAWLLFVIIRYAGHNGFVKAGICTALCCALVFGANYVVGRMLGDPVLFPAFTPFVWNEATLDANIKWIILLSGIVLGIIFVLIGILRKGKSKNEAS